jgi:hypothetical protein
MDGETWRPHVPKACGRCMSFLNFFCFFLEWGFIDNGPLNKYKKNLKNEETFIDAFFYV